MSTPRIFTPPYYAKMRDLEGQSWWNAAMRDIMVMLFDRIDLPEDGTLLDIGCGSGQTITWFTSVHPTWRGRGIDVSPDAVKAAVEAGLDVALASALDLPYEDDSADLIITLDVLQHLPLGGGDRTTFAEMKRVLRPGGHLFIRTNAQGFPRTEDDATYDFHKFEVGELRAKLQEAGFEVLRLSRVNALLGLAEIPRELRARAQEGPRYHGILAEPKPYDSTSGRLKRAWLRMEGRMVTAGMRLPLGRSIVALCRA